MRKGAIDVKPARVGRVLLIYVGILVGLRVHALPVLRGRERASEGHRFEDLRRGQGDSTPAGMPAMREAIYDIRKD